MQVTFNDHVSYKCKGYNKMFTKLLYVNRQRQLLSIPTKPMLSFIIVPYGTISGMQRNFAIDLIQSKE